MEIEQVEVTKLLGVTLDCKLSRSKHIDTTVAKMGRSLSITKLSLLNSTIIKAGPSGPSFYILNNTINKAGPTGPSFYILNNTINKASPTGPSFVAPRLLFSSVVRCHKEGLRKIAVGSEQGSTAGP